MVTRFVTSRGNVVDIGREIGKGGEGSVFEIKTTPKAVAKLYHAAIDRRKQEKLSLMARSATRDLLGFTSWPVDTLHRAAHGPVVGFVMPRITDRVPIHAVYGPVERRKLFPRAGWDFLVQVARNTAAAFATLHRHGHVLGDVNQGNVLVGRDGRVVLIDSDSFQIRAPRGLYLCEVGVAHFTPPELQASASFATVQRTSQHDAFGLALLIFHLLYGGRHPYAGVPLIPQAGNTLEEDIRSLRFAFARDARLRGKSPPPKSVPFAIVPEPIQRMFHAAFTEVGVRGKRPDAAAWVTALDDLGRRIRPCAARSVHRYPGHLASCPWCDLERQGVVHFPQPTAAAPAVAWDLRAAWARIDAVACPAVPAVPPIDRRGLTPRPLPAGLAPASGLIQRIASILEVGRVAAERNAEKARREQMLRVARRAFDELVFRLPSESGRAAFDAKKAELVRFRDDLRDLDSHEQAHLRKLHDAAATAQKQRFLESCLVADARIPGIGKAKVGALHAAGIRSAADVHSGRLLSIHGFGPTLASAVGTWRQACEQRFRFDPRLVPRADIDAARNWFVQRRRALEGALEAGPAALEQIVHDVRQQHTTLSHRLATAARRVAQAEVDLSVF